MKSNSGQKNTTSQKRWTNLLMLTRYALVYVCNLLLIPIFSSILKLFIMLLEYNYCSYYCKTR